MSVRFTITHKTVYRYDRPVFLTTHYFRLKPAAHSKVELEDFVLTINPTNHYQHWQQDPFGNFVSRIDFMGLMEEMSAEVKLTATIHPFNPFDFFVDEYAQSFPFIYPAALITSLQPYLEIVDHGPKLQQLVAKARAFTGSSINFLIHVNGMIKQEIAYTTRMEAGVHPSEELLDLKIGSCRDSAWLLVQVLRHLGLASRFVSGYLVQLAGEQSTFQDSIELHAWTEAYLPGAGWVGLDPTSGLLADEGHIPLACTTRPEDAAPVSGTTDPCESTFTYTSTVKRKALRQVW